MRNPGADADVGVLTGRYVEDRGLCRADWG
ncbi:hypothetical protein H4W31_006552 [Plantactinospora soyae]|uniref:Uncharacterized protein n=1 Tax=Plantactinospora soyae TaxID=1544732 RepID=A0A927MAH6_9ACTN|nr:hypothetical protein [Plantactinospora soyae]